MTDDKIEREKISESPHRRGEPVGKELTPQEMDQVAGGVQGPPIKTVDGGIITHIPGNPI
jgi:hypothetical protein